MKGTTLNQLAQLLAVLRARPELREVHPGTFLLDGRSFVHFHEESDGVFADLLIAKDLDPRRRARVHMRVSSSAEQAELLERIDDIFEAMEVHAGGRRRRPEDGQQRLYRGLK
jgi:hypothetical protein